MIYIIMIYKVKYLKFKVFINKLCKKKINNKIEKNKLI
jgi:hypothetical protein